MADITPYIEQIANARYGSEVRGAIVNALEAINSEILISGVSSFNNRTGDVLPAKDDYNINQIASTGGMDGQVPVVNTHGGFTLRNISGEITTLDGLTDVNISNPTNDQVLKYNSTTDEWYNSNESGGSSISPYISNPAMDGTASAGSSNDYARGDHVHPTDTSLMAKGFDYVTAGQKSGTTLGDYATAEGYNTTASETNAHAEGANTTASEANAHAEGYGTTASGYNSHAEGEDTTASGDSSHSEGYDTTASNDYSHAEGYKTTASESYAHAEGKNTTASGTGSHAEGSNTVASHTYSHASGLYTQTGTSTQFVCGKYNVGKATLFEIGNGTATTRSNALEVDTSGNLKATSYSNFSARKYKTNISDMTDDEAKKILQLNPVKYDYKSELLPNNQYGLIADDVEKIMTYPIVYENDEVDAIDYSKLVPALIKMVQIQQKEIDELKGR